jgi:hypothetical protein
VNLSCDAVKWSDSGQVTVTLRVADFSIFNCRRAVRRVLD